MGIQIYINEGQSPFPRGDNSKKIMMSVDSPLSKNDLFDGRTGYMYIYSDSWTWKLCSDSVIMSELFPRWYGNIKKDCSFSVFLWAYTKKMINLCSDHESMDKDFDFGCGFMLMVLYPLPIHSASFFNIFSLFHIISQCIRACTFISSNLIPFIQEWVLPYSLVKIGPVIRAVARN